MVLPNLNGLIEILITNIKNMLLKLKQAIINNQNLSENKCGTTVMSLMEELNLTSIEINNLLNQLHADKFIRIRQGINQKLIFLK